MREFLSRWVENRLLLVNFGASREVGGALQPSDAVCHKNDSATAAPHGPKLTARERVRWVSSG